MGISSRNPIVRSASASFVISILAVFAAAQQRPKVLAPHDPVAPEAKIHIPLSPIPRSIAGGPWIVDSHFESILYLKNVVENASISVTPVLYLSNGTKYQLSPVQIAPSGIAKIDVGASLENMGVAPLATLSGWVELQYNWPWDPVCAMLKVVDVTRSLVFSFGFAAPGPLSSKVQMAASQIRDGMWWKQEKNVTGFLTLANTTSQAMNATVDIEDKHAAILGSHNITVPPQGMATLDLLELQATSGTEGGIRVRWVGATDGLLINGGLEDAGVGYSATLPFKAPDRPLHPMEHKITPQSFAELGLMAGPADPYMNFPAGTIFTPYSVFRNVSSAPISVTPSLWWMQGSAPASFQLPSIRLLPFQTYSLDMLPLLESAGLKNFSGSVNLVLNTKGQPGLLMASGSVDRTNTYVFEVSPRGTVMSAGKSLSYWSTANGDDTMVTIWNPADEAQTFIFRLIFAGGHYDDVMALGPRATAMFDISDIIRTAGADPEGNIIPAGTQEGSAEIIGLEADNQHILLAVDSGVYNVRKATCSTGCTVCNGATEYYVSLDPFGVAVNGQAQESLIAQWNNGHRYDYTNTAAWSSSDMSIATVQTGLVKGVSPGSMTIHAIIAQEPVYAPYCGPGGQCPVEDGGGTAPGNVVNVQVTTVNLPSDTVTVQLSASQGSSGQLVVTWNGPSGNADIANATEGPGTYTFNPNLNNLANGQYTGVSAKWTVDEQPESGQYSTSFDVLGAYTTTQYNSPWESACTGSLAAAVITDSSCDTTNSKLKSDFISQVNENGSGFSLNWNGVQKEAYCVSEGKAPDNDSFRKNSPPAGSCYNNKGSLSDSTIAVGQEAFNSGTFQCGDQVLIVDTTGVAKAVKTVTDTCPVCDGQAHIDNYTTNPACSAGEVGDYGTGSYHIIRMR